VLQEVKSAAKRIKSTIDEARPHWGAKEPDGESAASASSISDGAPAPAFELDADSGERIDSQSLGGKPYVLYFYPKDDTPGCTTEACGFRDALSDFEKRGVRVLGVSPDSVKSHAKFKDKYGLTFDLLSDPEKVLANAYGVWVKKKNYGREYLGIQRSTFLVDRNGRVHKVWRQVRVPGHVDAVLAELDRLA
jgi:peroxiredoxin Q/BCP